ncbi:GGDEF domain-containing protein [Sporosarcina sp. YIM B06819]|uniref:GGDEF domain-containing protein n=1 Tax=Sporosarcina sp. YIM B06819 TaxID=3081769 RepID=UPI00298CE082|nr:GGDEF domain-containing protein [Sporosarcina sp. YIM B06819]
MNRHFRIQLTMVLIAFSLVLSLMITWFDYGKLKERVLIGHETKIGMAESKVVDSLTTIDNVYNLMDYQMADEMEIFSNELLAKYEEQPDFDKWDFQELKERMGMEIFIIDENNRVINSSMDKDIGLDFQKCCTGLAKLLTERRTGTAFTHDGMDLQQRTGEIKKFSYMPTPDHKYIIELSLPLEDKEIFQQFNFMKTIAFLEEKYDEINSIRVYNSAGRQLGVKEVRKVLPAMRSVIRETLSTEEPQERSDGNITYRYIPYFADDPRGLSTRRVVEIVYNNGELAGLLGIYRNEFILQLFIIIVASVGLSFIIARLVAKPIYLAFHDSLTGLKNRAAFDEEIKRRLAKKQGSVALMMIDIDNFKTVNDTLGHGEGDRILKLAATTIQDIVGPSHVIARVGGDEFVVVLSKIKERDLKQLAEKMVDKLKEELLAQRQLENMNVSISMGIAYATMHDEADTLYEKADYALYKSKENGKNQFNFYTVA